MQIIITPSFTAHQSTFTFRCFSKLLKFFVIKWGTEKGLTYPPSWSDLSVSDHQYYDLLRLPDVHLKVVPFSLSSLDTLYRRSLLFLFPPEADSVMGRNLLINTGILLTLDLLLPTLYTRKHLDLPSSQFTSMTACSDLRPRWCLDCSS